MLIAALAAFGLVLGLPPWMVGIGALAAKEPWAAPPLLAAWAILRWRRRRAGADPTMEARYLAAVAAELRAGSTIRVALVEAAHRVPEAPLRRVLRTARAGMEPERLAAELRAALPGEGTLAAAAVRLTATLGGSAAATFDRLAGHVEARAALRRELRGLTAQARLSAAVVALAPLVFGMLTIGLSQDVIADPAAVALVAIGALLEVVGVVVIVLLLRRTT